MNGSRQFAFQIHFDCDGHDVDTAASAKVDMAVSALVDAAHWRALFAAIKKGGTAVP